MMTLEDMQRATGINALTVNDIGQIRFKSGLTLTDRKRFLKQAVTVYKKHDRTWRFFLGDMINDLRLPYGQKKAYCRTAFGEHQGITFYGFSLTSAHWDEDSREYEVSWSLYKESGPMPEEQRLSIIRKVERREIKPEQALVECQDWKRENMPCGSSGADSDLKTGQKPSLSGSTLTTDNTITLEPMLQAVHCLATLQHVAALQMTLDARREELQEEEDDFADSQEE